jgi:cell division protein ZapA
VAKGPQSIRVVIYDQEYFMRGDLNEEYIQKLAQYLDTKMRSIAERTRTVDTLRVAMLAALNVADEYHQLKARHEEVTRHMDQKVGEYTNALDEILKDAVLSEGVRCQHLLSVGSGPWSLVTCHRQGTRGP